MSAMRHKKSIWINTFFYASLPYEKTELVFRAKSGAG